MISELVGGGPKVNPIHDFGWYRKHLYIQDRLSHQLVPIKPSGVQLRVRRAILDSEAREEPTRLIILKARREGVSTIVQATFAHRGFTRKNVWATTIAHEAPAASNLFGMTETMYHRLPPALRPAKVSGNLGRQLKLANDSWFKTETAKDIRAGRSGANFLLHGSEVAFWDHGEDVLRSITSTVPDVPGSIIILESTANGLNNHFYHLWKAAEKGLGYTPLFFSWLDDPVYSIPCDWEQLGPLDDDEDELRIELGASASQLLWRRRTIERDYPTDLDGFKQEFPATPNEAFITSGRLYFKPQALARFHPVEPLARGELDGKWKRGSEVQVVRNDKGRLWVYEPRTDGHRYVMFIDPAGTMGDTRAQHFADSRDAHDFTCMWVVDCTTMNTVAVWHGQEDIGLLGGIAARLGTIYNNAVICPEITGAWGVMVLEKLRDLGYGALHRDYNRQTYGSERDSRYGWSTTVATRPLMLATLTDYLREAPEKLRHQGLKDEMQTFVIGRVDNKPQAGPGSHDDTVLAAGGAYTIAQEYAQRTPIKIVSLAKKKRKGPFQDVLMRARR